MYRYLLASTALTTLAAFAAPVAAQTTIDDSQTTAVRTSTLKNGTGDSLRINTDGSIEVANGTAVTMDSDHDVSNEGEITITNADGANGILVDGSRSGDITNSGTITIDETYTATDADNDGDLDGRFAVGTNRAAIRATGPLTGDVVNSGTIVVEGNDSRGIMLESGLTGDLVHDGETNVTGDRGIGVDVSDVSGDVRLAGTITVVGEDSIGARLSGDISGALVVQGDISATGYRTVPAPTDSSELDADDLLQGGSALIIEGDVGEGIIFAVAPEDTETDDDDEDKDGIDDATEGDANITSYGEAPAVVIGATDRDIIIGSVPGTDPGFGIIVEGSILGSGLYPGVDGNGMVISGRGGAVDVENGMAVSGTISAISKDADATAMRLGAGANVPELHNSGTISADGGDSATAQSTAIMIDAGANMPYLRNSGTIKATVGDPEGSATAIRDNSGTLKLVENSGEIIASGADADSDRNVAIDLRTVSSGATIKQTVVASGIAAPLIQGDVLFSAGDDQFEIADGSVRGEVIFGAGQDEMILSGDAIFEGSADFGGDAGTVRLAGTSLLLGSLKDAQNVAVDVEGGTLDLTAPTSIASLSVGSAGVIGATLDKTPGSGTSITVSGTATFAQDSTLKLRLTDITDAEGTYEVLTAGNLVAADNLGADNALVPFMFEASLLVDADAGQINVDVDRKATEDLGLNRSQASAYEALYTALAEDDDIAGVFLGITEGDVFRSYVAQTLPDHAGGTFEGVSMGMRNFSRRLLDPNAPIEPEGKLGLIFDFAGWDVSKDEGETAEYDLDGLGFSGGFELSTGVGTFGVTATWLWNEHDSGFENTVVSDTYEAAAYWRAKLGPVAAFARGSYGMVDFHGSRYFSGTNVDQEVERNITREWDGSVTSFMGGVSLEVGSQFFFFRPSVIVDYIRLDEDGYTEEGGGDALNLTVDDRVGDELGLNLALISGFDLYGMRKSDENWLRIEAEGGRRELVGGELGSTTARFGEGDEFILVPEQRASGWFGRLRVMGGNEAYTFAGEFGGEELNENIGYTIRATLRMAM